MVQLAYAGDAWAALAKNPADRREGVRAMEAMRKAGGISYQPPAASS
jgi:hypothetical protein